PGGSSSPSGREARLPAEGFAGLDESVRAVMAAAGVPGAAVGVLVGEEAYVAGHGVTNVDYPLPVDGDTLFQIGSITKTFTMAALVRLVDQGRLDLDAPVQRALPDLRLADPEVAARVTLRHLLTHTSGLPANDWATLGGGDDALARYVATQGPTWPLLLPLGRAPSYSNIAFSVAGRVLEAVSGGPYAAAIEELLFAPLGMERATLSAADAIVAATAAGHTVLEGRPHVQRPWPMPHTGAPAGGIIASVGDLLRYARLWLRGGAGPDGARLFTPAALAEIGRPQAPNPGFPLSFGLTWLLGEAGGVTFWNHDGVTLGQTARLTVFPGHGVALVALTNANTGVAVFRVVQEWVQEHVLGLAAPPPPRVTPLPAGAAALAIYAGAYQNPGEATLTLRVRDGGLDLTTQVEDPFVGSVRPALPPDPLVHLALATPDEAYAVEAPEARAVFLRGAGGRIEGLLWGLRYNRRVG
ncbi:MAG TPA: serine hydrolase domain-containing protein, partial [Chloroflexota bacterium]|nr:serine hydrolase domain-containing protein [Chloroflexota bacterium]